MEKTMMAYDVFHRWMQFIRERVSCHLYLSETIIFDACVSFNTLNSVLEFERVDEYTGDGEKQSGHVN